jgi:ornithine cyclodeaminase/alanine dehydrogenase
MAAGELPTLFLTDGDVRAVFDWKSAVDTLRAAYAAANDPKRYPPRSMARGDRVWLRALTGVSPDGGLMGAKLIAASMRQQRASYLIPLFDQESVALLALLDGKFDHWFPDRCHFRACRRLPGASEAA